MVKRTIVFGGYNTAANGWTLAGWQLAPAKQKTNFVERTGGDGSWDLSTALTDGQPRYYDRTLTVNLEHSGGDRLNREAIIRQMVNQLDGQRVNIELPDDPFHYITGRLHVAREYNDPAHAAVTVTAVCSPWKHNTLETTITLTAATAEKTAQLVNNGRLAVVPTLTVTGSSVLIKFGNISKALGAGTHQMPDLLLTSGTHTLTYSGTGMLAIKYREAVLE
jgi:hypothetical protein